MKSDNNFSKIFRNVFLINLLVLTIFSLVIFIYSIIINSALSYGIIVLFYLMPGFFFVNSIAALICLIKKRKYLAAAFFISGILMILIGAGVCFTGVYGLDSLGINTGF